MASAESELVSDKMDASSAERLRAVETYRQAFGGLLPEFVVRAPGRVNIIGEHIDYCGFSVLPCALEDQAIWIAVGRDGSAAGDEHPDKKRKNHHWVCNSDDEQFPGFSIPRQGAITVQAGGGWDTYFGCGYKGASERWQPPPAAYPGSGPLFFAVHGDVPQAAGLSSSSALVCASLVACGWLWGPRCVGASRAKLAELACAAERWTGVQGGGMDQAISMIGGSQRISFGPVRAEAAPLPEGACLLVAHSLVQARKGAGARRNYNRRVGECTLAGALLLSAVSIPLSAILGQDESADSAGNAKLLRHGAILLSVQQALLPGTDGDQVAASEAMLERVAECLREDPYSLEDVAGVLQCSVAEVRRLGWPKSPDDAPGSDTDRCLFLRQRAWHVFSEAGRVSQFALLCQERGPLKELGQLMNESHASCSMLYDCSHEQLDDLVTQCRALGALGARLTGAGWGGYVVALLDQRNTDTQEFGDALSQSFYQSKDLSGFPDPPFFITQPGAGVQVFELN